MIVLVKKSTGRFDLTLEDEHEILTNSVTQDDQLVNRVYSFNFCCIIGLSCTVCDISLTGEYANKSNNLNASLLVFNQHFDQWILVSSIKDISQN